MKDNSIPQNASCVSLELDGKLRSVYCPQSAKELIEGVLGGQEYPCSLLPARFRPKIIVDVGAHVGGATLYFHKQYPEAQIYSYEPCPEYFDYLKLNTAGRPNIWLHPYGLYNQTAELPLYKPPYSTNSLIRPMGSGTPDFDIVRVVRASEELVSKDLTNISLLKLDVEGSEVEVLADIFTNVRELFIICLFVEYHNAAIVGAIREMLGDFYDITPCHEHVPGRLGVLRLLDKRCVGLMK